MKFPTQSLHIQFFVLYSSQKRVEICEEENCKKLDQFLVDVIRREVSYKKKAHDTTWLPLITFKFYSSSLNTRQHIL
jgi:hypothetical protein